MRASPISLTWLDWGNSDGAYHWNPLESIGIEDWEDRVCWADTDRENHWSALELEIKKRDYTKPIQMVITIIAHWSPLELEIENRDNTELIQMMISIWVNWSWGLVIETMLSGSIEINWTFSIFKENLAAFSFLTSTLF